MDKIEFLQSLALKALRILALAFFIDIAVELIEHITEGA